MNATFGWPAFMYENLPGGGPAFPVGTLGVRLAVSPLDWFKFRTAIFQGNVYAQNVNLHGFRWRLDSQNGFFLLNEAQFLWNQSDKQMGLPGQFEAGAWLDTPKATYLAQITKRLSIQPDVQVIINPGGNKDLSNALVIGGRISITF